ncbi:MAG: hypothetical protein RLZZ628_2067 [Bacteroidota bacterium]|jgi:AAA+ ATPase superfamily predicted ATPase
MTTIEIIGRAKEKARLEKILQSNQAEFLALYGRRRVGKTFLIRQYLKKELVFDFSGSKEASKKQQLNNFFAEYLARTQGKQETLVPTSWQMAFRYLADYLSGLSGNATKQVVFLDEMPWLDTPKSDFISALEFFLESTRIKNGSRFIDSVWFGIVLDSERPYPCKRRTL